MSATNRPSVFTLSVFKKTALTLSTVFAVSIASSGIAAAAAHKHIDRYAVRIQQKSQRLLKELNHYQHTPEYSHLVQDTIELRDAAQHIHDVTHFSGNLAHLRTDLASLDRSFHHLEGLFDHIENEAEHGHGHVHGNTRHVKNLLNSIERDIHHLQKDVSKLGTVLVPAVAPVTQYRSYYSGSNGHGHDYHNSGHGHGHNNNRSNSHRGFSIGGGSSQIWFSF